MKTRTIVITFLSAVALVAGCEKEPTTSQQIDKAQADTKHAEQEMKDYAFAQKSEFVEKMQVQLAALNKDLDELTAKVEKGSDSVKADAKPRLAELHEQTSKLGKQLDEVKNASESTWDSVKDGFKKAYDSSKDGFQKARQWVAEKISP